MTIESPFQEKIKFAEYNFWMICLIHGHCYKERIRQIECDQALVENDKLDFHTSFYILYFGLKVLNQRGGKKDNKIQLVHNI